MWLHSAKFCTMKNFGMYDKKVQSTACPSIPESFWPLLGRFLACYSLLPSQEVHVGFILPMLPPPDHEAETSLLCVQIWKEVTQLARWIRQRDPTLNEYSSTRLRFGYQSLSRIVVLLALCGWASPLLFLAQGIRDYNKHMQRKPFNGDLFLSSCFQSERKPERSKFINTPLAKHPTLVINWISFELWGNHSTLTWDSDGFGMKFQVGNFRYFAHFGSFIPNNASVFYNENLGTRTLYVSLCSWTTT